MTSNEDIDVIELLKKKIDEAEQRLARLKNALAACSSNGVSSSWQKVAQEAAEAHYAKVSPPIYDICNYLKETGGIVHQREIIDAVGTLRRDRYPALTNHYSPIWRALEFHVRHNRLIACVDERGGPAKLKPLPHRPRGKKITNSPEFYDQDNWFQLKDESHESQRSDRTITQLHRDTL